MELLDLHYMEVSIDWGPSSYLGPPLKCALYLQQLVANFTLLVLSECSTSTKEQCEPIAGLHKELDSMHALTMSL